VARFEGRTFEGIISGECSGQVERQMGYTVDPGMMPAANGDYTKVKLKLGKRNDDGTVNVIIQQ
jgi:hypothetical protein